MDNGVSRQAVEWAALFTEFERPLTAYAVSLTGHIEDARDLIQDVMVNLVHAAADPSNKKQFAMKAIRNRAIDRARGERSRRNRLGRGWPDGAFLLEHNRTSDVSDTAELAEQLLASLNDSQREVVVLHLYAEFTFTEIAEVLDKPLGTVTSLYARSLARMREAAQGEVQDAR